MQKGGGRVQQLLKVRTKRTISNLKLSCPKLKSCYSLLENKLILSIATYTLLATINITQVHFPLPKLGLNSSFSNEVAQKGVTQLKSDFAKTLFFFITATL